MTETDQAPTLTWGPETTRIVVGATMATAGLLRQRRMEMGRFAFSDAEDAARRFDRVQRAAEPSVRFMDDAERRSWDAERRAEDSMIERRVVRDQSNILSVEVGPLVDSRWGVCTRYEPNSPHEPGDAHSMSLSCADELTARKLAEELMAGGPDRDRLGRLEGFVSLASQRSAALGASEVREPEQQRHARAAQAVRQVWEGTLAEEVVSSKAFGALAWRLFELEERGYAMTDVLRRIDDSRLRRADVRNPAALAEFFVVQMMPNLRVIDLDGDLSAQPQPDRTAGTPPRSGTRPGQEPAAGEEQAIGPLLAAALPPEVLEKVRQAPSYDRLRRDLFERYQQGRPVAELLEDLAVGEVAEATDPAGYLAGIVRRRADTDPLRATQVNRAGMAELVQRGLPREAADKVVDCQAWPGLAKRLAAWQAEGLPVANLLAALPAGRIFTARTPAAYATALMNAEAAGARAAMAGESPDPSPQERAQGRHRSGQGQPGTRSGRAGTSRPARAEGTDDALEWTEQLDPSSAIDQVGLEATIGLGSPAREARLDARLRAGTDPEAAGHTTGAETAGARAEAHERDAAYGWSTLGPGGHRRAGGPRRARPCSRRRAPGGGGTRYRGRRTWHRIDGGHPRRGHCHPRRHPPSDGNPARVSRVPGVPHCRCVPARNRREAGVDDHHDDHRDAQRRSRAPASWRRRTTACRGSVAGGSSPLAPQSRSQCAAWTRCQPNAHRSADSPPRSASASR